jgi:hypothetical protein
MFCWIELAGRIGMKKKPSAPHSRLGYIHLLTSLVSATVHRVTVDFRSVKKKSALEQKNF